MEIFDMQINHFTNPIGFNYQDPTFTYKIKNSHGKKVIAHQLKIALDKEFNHIIYDSKKIPTFQTLFTNIVVDYLPRTRYWWKVQTWTDINETVSKTSWFETGKLNEAWSGKWLMVEDTSLPSVKFSRSFHLNGKIKSARLYFCGLGLAEAYLNNKKVGNEFLTPGYNNYDAWIQYQSYDITAYLHNINNIDILLGKGWYKGRFGFHGGTENIYGSHLKLLLEIHLQYQNGQTEIISTDDQWQATTGIIGENSIYYGEDQNELANFNQKVRYFSANMQKNRLQERLSVPVIVEEEVSVKKVLTGTETILDMGQNMVGWLCFKNYLPKNVKVKFEFAETLIHGKFYRSNLREARAAFVYTSNGENKWVRPHFTFFGFRYVRITGWPKNLDLNLNNFKGWVLMSQMQRTGYFKTSNPQVNRLYQNLIWSQKGNFIEVPTDCPQRDERMGWTGDAQLFSKTALYNFDAYAFYQKYGYDMKTEQKKHGGAPTMTVPDVPSDLNFSPLANGVWGDAAVIIPWNSYLTTGDTRILRQQFDSMKEWIDYVYSRPFERGLWSKDFQFGDWLALDGEDPNSPVGGTEAKFVANVYLFNSLKIVAKTAKIIGAKDTFTEKAVSLKKALRNEYFTVNGRFVQDTQTGYLLALTFGLLTQKEKDLNVKRLAERLRKDNFHLKTGFTGTPLLNMVLSRYNLNDLAYTLLLNNDYPSWLYEVKMGATTIWERWNSILENGDINPEGMNSLNHYAYGAIGNWFYEGILGIHGLNPGYSQIRIAPNIHWSIHQFTGTYLTTNGTLKIDFKVDSQNRIILNLTVPFNTLVKLKLPNLAEKEKNKFKQYYWEGEYLKLSMGNYEFNYQSSQNLNFHFNLNLTLREIWQDPMILVRFRTHFAGQKIVSNRFLMSNSEDSLRILISKKLVDSNQVESFLNNLNQLVN